MNIRARKGFTLIEILIVVAIVGILASVALVGLGPVQQKGRDARRISDIRQVQTALELYFNKYGQYPVNQSGWCMLVDTLKGAGIGTNRVPDDPRATGCPGGANHYGYASNQTGTVYILQAHMEDLSNPVLNDDIDGSNALGLGIDCGTGGPGTDEYYCVTL